MKKIISLLCACCCAFTISAQKVVDRQEVDFNKIKGSTVLFTFGQSNSACHGQTPYTPKHAVYNYYEGKLYQTKDPLLGVTGRGSSVWGILGDKMIEAGLTDAVTIIPLGVGGAAIDVWSKGSGQYKRLEKTLDELLRQGVKIDCICWHQGESDNIKNTPAEKYMEDFLVIRDVFRSRGIDAPIMVALASYHPYCVAETEGCSEEIRKAQKELAKQYDDIYQGPDTDKLNKCYQRHDGVHFSSMGQPMHADMWLKSLRKILKKKK